MTEETTQTENNETSTEEKDALEAAAEEAAKKSEEPASEGEGGGTTDDDAPSGAPEAYDTAAFQMPDGIEFDQEGFDAVEPTLRELDLNQDQAGKLMSIYGEKVAPMIAKRTEQAITDAGDKLKADLAASLKSDPVVGGAKLEEAQALAAKAQDYFIKDEGERKELTEFLETTGLGNNRFLMRIMAGAGRAISESSTPPASNGTSEKTTVDKFYGS